MIYMDDIKIFAKNEIELETDTNNKNMHLEYRNGKWH